MDQLDGNTSLYTDTRANNKYRVNQKTKVDKFEAALNLPIIATYNLRSLMPKIKSLKNDLIERSVSLGFLQETWEQTENGAHQQKKIFL